MQTETKKAQHTPGPWEAIPAKNEYGEHTISIRGDGQFIATMDTVSVDGGEYSLPPEAAANARLIAAACNSYNKHFGPRAVEAAEADVLGKALEALREINDAVPSGDPIRMAGFAASLQNIAAAVLDLVDGGAA